MKFHLPILTLALAIAPAFVSADVILFEDFEDAADLTYVQGGAVNFGDTNVTLDSPLQDNTQANFLGSNTDYFGRVDNSIIEANYTGVSGNTFWGAQNTSGDTNDGPDTVTLTWTGIDISNFTNLTFDGLFASFDNFPGGQWDPSTSVRIEAEIDGDGDDFFYVAGFESINNSEDDNAARNDTDDSGAGDGAFLLANEFRLFSQEAGLTADINGTGNLLSLRITVDSLNSEGEDIAFDDISISGDLQNIPEPASLLLFGSALGACVIPRRRKSLFNFLSK